MFTCMQMIVVSLQLQDLRKKNQIFYMPLSTKVIAITYIKRVVLLIN